MKKRLTSVVSAWASTPCRLRYPLYPRLPLPQPPYPPLTFHLPPLRPIVAPMTQRRCCRLRLPALHAPAPKLHELTVASPSTARPHQAEILPSEIQAVLRPLLPWLRAADGQAVATAREVEAASLLQAVVAAVAAAESSQGHLHDPWGCLGLQSMPVQTVDRTSGCSSHSGWGSLCQPQASLCVGDRCMPCQTTGRWGATKGRSSCSTAGDSAEDSSLVVRSDRRLLASTCQVAELVRVCEGWATWCIRTA